MLFRALSVPSMPSSAVSTTAVAQDSNPDSILREVYEDFQKKIVILADTANACYTSAIEIFAILQNKPTDGNANLIAVRCNMSCLRRFLSSTLCEMIQKSIKERSDSPSAILQTNSSPLLKCSLRSRKRDHTGAKFFSPLEYIYQAVEICQDSIFNIQSSAALQSTGAPSILSLELATNYTFSGPLPAFFRSLLPLTCDSLCSSEGLLYRKCLGEISISSVLNTKVAVTPNTEEIIRLIHQAIEHFEKGEEFIHFLFFSSSSSQHSRSSMRLQVILQRPRISPSSTTTWGHSGQCFGDTKFGSSPTISLLNTKTISNNL
jgi:hypothetical protein